MGAQNSTPESDLSNDGEATFFARRDAPVQFSEGLMAHLSSSSVAPSAARQETLDSHIQQRINQELSRLREQEASVRDEIEQALQKENLDRERGDAEDKGVTHSASLLRDLEELEQRTVGLREESRKNKDGEAWVELDGGRKALAECFLGNKDTPLNCREAADAFISAVSGVEKTFVESL